MRHKIAVLLCMSTCAGRYCHTRNILAAAVFSRTGTPIVVDYPEYELNRSIIFSRNIHRVFLCPSLFVIVDPPVCVCVCCDLSSGIIVIAALDQSYL